MIVLIAFALGMAWFAYRRYREAHAELVHRTDVQARLAEALAEQKRLAQRYLRLQEEERKALARELHDELGQYLNAIKIDAVGIRDGTGDGNDTGPASRRAAALSIIHSADHVHATISDLIRRLRPVGLDELGLAAALEHCVEGARSRLPATQIRLAVEGDVDRLGEALDLTIYRLVQEGLTNCAKHASATEVDIRLARARSHDGGPDEVAVSMTDNGAGAAQPKKGLGLVGMRERVEALGGEFTVSSAPGYGFRFAARLPIDNTTLVSRAEERVQ
jgi:signal transduction histidine kinase